MAYICDDCGFSFSRRFNLIRHQTRKHSKQEEKLDEAMEADENETSGSEDNEHDDSGSDDNEASDNGETIDDENGESDDEQPDTYHPKKFWREIFKHGYENFRQTHDFIPFKKLIHEPSLTMFMDEMFDELQYVWIMSKLQNKDKLFDRIMGEYDDIKGSESDMSVQALEEAFFNKKHAIRVLLKENIDCLVEKEKNIESDQNENDASAV